MCEPTPYLIRSATSSDIDPLVALAAAERGDLEMGQRLELDLRGPDRRLFVATVADRLAGYGRAAHFEPPVEAPANVAPAGYYLSGLLVAPPWRRRGLGAALIRARLDWIFVRADEAWYFANARNHTSLKLHAQLGFIEITRDFTYPGVTFEGGVGVLARASKATHAESSSREPDSSERSEPG